jgi:Flp pilus assembly protein TadG
MGRPVTWIRSFFQRHPRGQSLVEFTILLPVLLMMLSGLIEFGFLLNSYLDVIDAARDTARFAANDDPTVGAPTDDWVTNPNFWTRGWKNGRSFLYTASDARINWNPANPVDCTGVEGDVVLSAFSVLGNTIDKRFPAGYPSGAINCAAPRGTSTYTSKFTIAQLDALLSGAAIPNSGIIVVEVFYEYHMVMGLPWIQAFVPDPIVLYAYTIMPNTYVEPTPTP